MSLFSSMEFRVQHKLPIVMRCDLTLSWCMFTSASFTLGGQSGGRISRDGLLTCETEVRLFFWNYLWIMVLLEIYDFPKQPVFLLLLSFTLGLSVCAWQSFCLLLFCSYCGSHGLFYISFPCPISLFSNSLP